MKQTGLDTPQLPLLINGELIEATGNVYFDSINPSTGDVQAAIAAAKSAFVSGVWSGLSVKERGKYLKRIAELIRENAKVLAELECLDAGKTGKQTTFIDIPTCADTFE